MFISSMLITRVNYTLLGAYRGCAYREPFAAAVALLCCISWGLSYLCVFLLLLDAYRLPLLLASRQLQLLFYLLLGAVV